MTIFNRFLGCAPVLSYESKNGGFARNDPIRVDDTLSNGAGGAGIGGLNTKTTPPTGGGANRF